jgi:hypothetical protein
MNKSYPIKPGYYWARWTVAANGTHEGDQLATGQSWEIVEVWPNYTHWDRDPMEDEALAVSVPGVRETQWRDCFLWGNFVAELDSPS